MASPAVASSCLQPCDGNNHSHSSHPDVDVCRAGVDGWWYVLVLGLVLVMVLVLVLVLVLGQPNPSLHTPSDSYWHCSDDRLAVLLTPAERLASTRGGRV